jgi:hypothetical protein
MKKEEFTQKMEKCFYGSGGGIFQEYYNEAKISDETLDKVIKDLLSDFQYEFEDPDKNDTEFMEKMRNLKTETNNEKITFFKEYLNYPHDRMCSYPELCGSICGIMARDKMYDEVNDFLKLDNFEDDEMSWDS